MGRLADRIGIVLPVMVGAGSLAAGFVLAALSGGLWSFSAAYLLIGTFGTAATFAPLLADISLWFERRRGIAVALCASGNYLSGAIWPTLIESAIRAHGWRTAHLAVGVICFVAMPPLALLLRGRPPTRAAGAPAPAASRREVDLPPRVLHSLLRSPAWPVVWRCRCHRFTSWPIAVTWVTDRPEAPGCCP